MSDKHSRETLNALLSPQSPAEIALLQHSKLNERWHRWQTVRVLPPPPRQRDFLHRHAYKLTALVASILSAGACLSVYALTQGETLSALALALIFFASVPMLSHKVFDAALSEKKARAGNRDHKRMQRDIKWIQASRQAKGLGNSRFLAPNSLTRGTSESLWETYTTRAHRGEYPTGEDPAGAHRAGGHRAEGRRAGAHRVGAHRAEQHRAREQSPVLGDGATYSAYAVRHHVSSNQLQLLKYRVFGDKLKACSIYEETVQSEIEDYVSQAAELAALAASAEAASYERAVEVEAESKLLETSQREEQHLAKLDTTTRADTIRSIIRS